LECTPIFLKFRSLWVTCLGLILFGLGIGATLVSGFAQMLQDAV